MDAELGERAWLRAQFEQELVRVDSLEPGARFISRTGRVHRVKGPHATLAGITLTDAEDDCVEHMWMGNADVVPLATDEFTAEMNQETEP